MSSLNCLLQLQYLLQTNVIVPHITHNLNIRPSFSPSHMVGQHILMCNTICTNTTFHCSVTSGCRLALHIFTVSSCYSCKIHGDLLLSWEVDQKSSSRPKLPNLLYLKISSKNIYKEYLQLCGTGYPLVKSQVLFSHLSSNSQLCHGSYQLVRWTLLIRGSLHFHRMFSKN